MKKKEKSGERENKEEPEKGEENMLKGHWHRSGEFSCVLFHVCFFTFSKCFQISSNKMN